MRRSALVVEQVHGRRSIGAEPYRHAPAPMITTMSHPSHDDRRGTSPNSPLHSPGHIRPAPSRGPRAAAAASGPKGGHTHDACLRTHGHPRRRPRRPEGPGLGQDRSPTAIAAAGGTVHGKPDWWGKRQFAYPINKKESGYYVVFELLAPGGALDELERTLRLADDVVRHKLIRLPDAEAARRGMTVAAA